MTGSYWQVRQCRECGADILMDTRGPLTTDPNEHQDDCPYADPWPDSPDWYAAASATIDS